MPPDPVRFGPFLLDRDQKLLFRDGEGVALTPKAFELLDLLVENAGRVVDKDALLRGVWPDTSVEEANLAHHVFMLRRALGDDREGNRFIETVPRRGYRFVAELAEGEAADAIVIDERSERITIEETVATPKRNRALLALLILAAIASLAAVAVMWPRATPHQEAQPRTLRFSIAPPPSTTFMQFPATTELAVSPDGRMLVMVALERQRRKLYVREFNALGARAIAGTDDAMAPFWSPDSKWIGFFAGGSMKKVPLDGGPAETICPARGAMGSWNANGQILFSEWGPGSSNAVRMVHQSGGAIRDLTDDATGGIAFWPSFLPDGRHFIYYSMRPPKSGLYVGSIDDRKLHLVALVNSHAEVRGEDVYYVREGVLVRQKLDLKRFTTTGDPIPIASPVFCFIPLGTANFSLSRDASVIAWQRRMLATQLVWRDWNGRELARVGKPELYRRFSIAPDGRRIAADVANATTEIPEIRVLDAERGVGTGIATDWVNTSPLWLGNDALIIGVGNRAHPGDAPAMSLLQLDNGSIRTLRRGDGPQYATSVSADRSRVVYTVNRGRYSEIEAFSVANPTAKTSLEPSPSFDVSDAVLSPDDRWLAYQSSESGRPEIYLRPFDRSGEKIRVSTAGGSEPQWTVDGDAVLFLSPDGMLMKATLSGGAAPRVTTESILFPISSAGMMEMMSLGRSHYAVTRDRILTREIPGGFDADPVMVLFAR